MSMLLQQFSLVSSSVYDVTVFTSKCSSTHEKTSCKKQQDLATILAARKLIVLQFVLQYLQESCTNTHVLMQDSCKKLAWNDARFLHCKEEYLACNLQDILTYTCFIP